LLNRTVLAEGTTAETFTEENLVMTFGGLPMTSLRAIATEKNNHAQQSTEVDA
jgi:manganese transport system ATP-binding protein